MKPKLFVLPVVVAAAIVALVTWAAHSPHMPTALAVAVGRAPATAGVDETVARLDRLLLSNWQAELKPACRKNHRCRERSTDSASRHGSIFPIR